ncbi:MAG: hypothetical protein K8T10_04375 [Candidatus Eremiobacteraeota bacterium]|nr:hypothetical protein [Candidatus Eremiobacteraeota bacterium]
MKTLKKSLPDISELSIEEKVAQMFIIDFPGHEINDRTRRHFRDISWGGVILFAKNIESRKQTENLNQSLMKLNDKLPMMISLDQEGGIVNRADFPDMNLLPGNMALGAGGDIDMVEKMYRISGQELKELGFHMDYAPVADVNSNPDNPLIGVRSFGDDPIDVGEMTSAAVRGMQSAGLSACAKHFPGHGDTILDSHLELPRIDAPIERIEKVELHPFKKAIDAGVEAIMTAHIIFGAFDTDDPVPATLSYKILTELLRKKMGFNGLIVTDSMRMKAIADNYSPVESAVMTVKAGADIILMLGHFETQVEGYDAVLESVRTGEISEERIDESVERILDFKKRYIVNPTPASLIPTQERIDFTRKATQKGITIINGNEKIPVDLSGKKVLVFSPDRLFRTLLEESDTGASVFPYIKKINNNAKRFVYNLEDPEAIVSEKSFEYNPDIVVFELFSRGRMPADTAEKWTQIIKRLHEKGVFVILISLLSPYGLPKNADITMTGYNYSTLNMEMAASRLLGE